MGKKHYDWNEIQKSYDDGNSTRDLTKIFGVSHGSFQKARNRGDFNSYRTIKEAMVIARKKYPDSFKLSDITKKKISDFRIQYYKENPEMHPNRLLANNRNKWTYPERLAAEWFENNKIEFLYNKKILEYYPDFLIDNMIIIEIDGERWHSSDEAKKKDEIRDFELIKNGYTVYRIPSNNVIENLEKIFRSMV